MKSFEIEFRADDGLTYTLQGDYEKSGEWVHETPDGLAEAPDITVVDWYITNQQDNDVSAQFAADDITEMVINYDFECEG